MNSFGQQYPFKSDVDPWFLITKYLNEGGFLVGFGRAMQYPLTCQNICCVEPNVFLGYLKRGIVGVLSSLGHEQYPSDSLNQNKSTHGVYSAMRVLRSL